MELKLRDEQSCMYLPYAQSFDQRLKKLDSAYQNFFHKLLGHPQHASRCYGDYSMVYPQGSWLHNYQCAPVIQMTVNEMNLMKFVVRWTAFR